MLIFENKNKYYVFIHIPKNSGKYIRNKITNNIDNKIINFIYRFGETIYIILNKFSEEYKRKEISNENIKISTIYH